MKKGFRIIKFKKDKPIFQIKDISKSYDGRPILKKINMNLHLKSVWYIFIIFVEFMFLEYFFLSLGTLYLYHI